MMPREPLGFVGGMWVRVDKTGMNYPKYPNGLPLLCACVLWIFGQAQGGAGVKWAYLVSPIGASMALLGMYLLARQFAGIFASMLTVLLLAFSQVTLCLADVPNSHASCLAFVVWGIYLLVRFWRTAAIWAGVLGGFCIGYAATIRYTEGLLVLLIGFVMLTMIRWRGWREWRELYAQNAPPSAWMEAVLNVGSLRMIRWREWGNLARVLSPLIGWLIPVVYLVTFNMIAMGTPTGYDTTNESKFGSAFTLAHIVQNWEKLIRQVHDTGLFFVVPVGILGMAAAYRLSSRRASLLWLWLLPGTMIYMAYYWAPDRGVSYLRFFLTLFPPILVGAAILFDYLLKMPAPRWPQRLVAPLACGAIVAMSCAIGLYRGILGLDDGQETGTGLEAQYRTNASLAQVGDVVTRVVPPGSMIFASTQHLHHLQFVGDYECFTPEYFSAAFITRLKKREETVDIDNDPVGQQMQRNNYLLRIVEGHDDKQMIQMLDDLLDHHLASGQRIFVIMNKPGVDGFAKRFLPKKLYDTRLLATVVDVPRLMIDAPPDPIAKPVVARGRPPAPARRDIPQSWQIVEITRAKP
jgi:hypothetical protein